MKFLNSARNAASRLVTTLAATGFLLGATPEHAGNASSPPKKFEDTVLPCLFVEAYDPERRYTSEDIDRIIHEAYICTPNKPDYLTEDFVREIARAESNDDPMIIGYKIKQDSTGKFVHAKNKYGKMIHSGANGLYQLREIAWRDGQKRLHYYSSYDDDVFNPRINADIWMRYSLFLDEYARQHHPRFDFLNHSEKRQTMAAGNNGGPVKLDKKMWNINRMYAETRAYVKKIVARSGD